jgi:hypothetical protein
MMNAESIGAGERLSIGLVAATLSLSMGIGRAEAWGWRGHREICVAATRLVQAPELREFLSARAEMIGVLCNIPDIRWKNLGEEIRRVGDPTHYQSFEKLRVSCIEEVPTSVRSFLQLGAKAGIGDVAGEVGTLWWRADQFVREAVRTGAPILAADLPARDRYQDMTHPYNRAVYGMLTSLGILGHFVGDASMPYHNTEDRDGWKNGHGGIHFYYEELAVNERSLTLTEEIRKTARPFRRDPKRDPDVLEIMKELSVQAFSEIPEIERRDPVVTPSRTEGEKIRAVRSDPTPQTFGELPVLQMARSAAALADLWDAVYLQLTERAAPGTKDPLRLRSYRSYANFSVSETAPEFLAPDYLK